MQEFKGQPNADELILNEVSKESLKFKDNNIFADSLALLFSNDEEGIDTEIKKLLKEFHPIYTRSFESLDIKA